jgi:hypothetical protein
MRRTALLGLVGLLVLGLGTGALALVAKDGEVIDARRSLAWQAGEGPGLVNLADAQKHCAALAPAGAWRVPSKGQLLGLVDVKAGTPAIDRKLFPQAAAVRYWTDTKGGTSDFDVWVVDFTKGKPFFNSSKAVNARVRCVREMRAASGPRLSRLSGDLFRCRPRPRGRAARPTGEPAGRRRRGSAPRAAGQAGCG